SLRGTEARHRGLARREKKPLRGVRRAASCRTKLSIVDGQGPRRVEVVRGVGTQPGGKWLKEEGELAAHPGAEPATAKHHEARARRREARRSLAPAVGVVAKDAAARRRSPVVSSGPAHPSAKHDE